MAGAKQYERVRLLVAKGLDEIPQNVFGHEIPILEAAIGKDALRYRSRRSFRPVKSPQAEYRRLEGVYGRDLAAQVYRGGAQDFQPYLDQGASHIDVLEAQEKKRHPPAPPPVDPAVRNRERKARELRGELVTKAADRRQWLLGGTGLPKSAQATTAAQQIESALIGGTIQIGRAETAALAMSAFDTAKAAIEAVHLDDVAPTWRLVGAAHPLRPGHTLPSVRRSDPPFTAAEIEAVTPGAPADPVFIEHAQAENDAEMRTERYFVQGNARVRLKWLTETPAAPAVVKLRARNAAAASEREVTVPVPTLPRAGEHD